MKRGSRRLLKRVLLLAVPAAGVAAAPWHMALLAVVAVVAVAVLVAWRAHGRARGRAVFFALLAIAALTAGRDVWDASHIGAPSISYPCPKGSFFSVWWVPESDPEGSGGVGSGVQDYNGWREITTCAAKLTITAG